VVIEAVKEGAAADVTAGNLERWIYRRGVGSERPFCLPRITECPVHKCGDEFSEHPRRAVCQSEGRKSVLRGLLPADPAPSPEIARDGDWGAPSVEKVAIDQLRLADLQGRPVDLYDYCREYSLLIFLRHLA
jgi:hypothetical protein